MNEEIMPFGGKSMKVEHITLSKIARIKIAEIACFFSNAEYIDLKISKKDNM
jgi:hypothetical protein